MMQSWVPVATQHFLDLWKDADPGISIRKQATAKYAGPR
jgi:hypothetical protein